MFDIEPVSLGISIFLLLGLITPIYLNKRTQSKKISLQKRVFQQNEKINNGRINREILYKIGIKLASQKSNHPEIHLEFYNGDLFSDHQGEEPLAAKWEELIAQNLKKIT